MCIQHVPHSQVLLSHGQNWRERHTWRAPSGNTINDTQDHPESKQLGVKVEIGLTFSRTSFKLWPGRNDGTSYTINARFLKDQSAKCQYGAIRVVHVHVCKTQRVLHQGDYTEMSYAEGITLRSGVSPLRDSTCIAFQCGEWRQNLTKFLSCAQNLVLRLIEASSALMWNFTSTQGLSDIYGRHCAFKDTCAKQVK